jgi:ferredoxin
MSNIIIATVVTFLILGGPLTVFAFIKIFSWITGRITVQFVRTDLGASEGAPLALQINWDEAMLEDGINRVKVDFMELVRGGRSATFSFTFEDKAAKKKSFVIPMKLDPEDVMMLTDGGIPEQRRAFSRSYAVIEVENTRGEVVRRKVSKAKILETLNQSPVSKTPELDITPALAPDSWGVMSRVFPWRVAIAEAEAPKKDGAKKAKAAAGGAPKIFDFLITKVWIEPGCIVCDACENEAPDVFEVLADTCIVRPNAPMGDVGAIVAAAEGCPVDVIKYDRAAK